MTHGSDLKLPGAWLSRCLAETAPRLHAARDLDRGSGCRLWDCETSSGRLALKLYSPGFDDYSAIGPVDTAREHALALQGLPQFGVPTPRCLGFAAEGEEAAVAMEWLAGQPFTSAARLEAARVLARLHGIRSAELSAELADLILRSTPNRGRIGEAPDEPPLSTTTLQHGDYFSVNLACGKADLCVLDWDLLAIGDPMWDLGFLLYADRGVPEEEAEAVIAAYQEHRRADLARLAWQRACWELYWHERDAVR